MKYALCILAGLIAPSLNQGAILNRGPVTIPAASGALFSDGFESGNTSAWTSTTDSGGKISVSTDFAHTGTYSLKITTGTTAVAYIRKDLAANHPEGFWITFWVLSNDVTAVNGSNAEMRVASLYDLSSNEQGRVSFYTESGSPWDWKRQNCTYVDDSGAQFAGYSILGTTPAANNWYKVTYYILVSTAPGANNGQMKIYWNDNNTPETSITAIDNDTKAGVGQIRVGIPSHNWNTSNGTIIYIDDVSCGSGVPSDP